MVMVDEDAHNAYCVSKARLCGCWHGQSHSRSGRIRRRAWTRGSMRSTCQSAIGRSPRRAPKSVVFLYISGSLAPIFSSPAAQGRLRPLPRELSAGSRPLTEVREVRIPVGVQAATSAHTRLTVRGTRSVPATTASLSSALLLQYRRSPDTSQGLPLQSLSAQTQTIERECGLRLLAVAALVLNERKKCSLQPCYSLQPHSVAAYRCKSARASCPLSWR